MGDRSMFRPAFHTLVAGAVLVLSGMAAPAFAAHDLGQDCYTCHNIKSGQVWQGSYSVWSGLSIGMSPYARPITCEVCHTDYGDRFKATSVSHHPVEVIAGASMNSSYDNGVRIRCKECHNANTVTALTPNLIPDLAPTDYLGTAGNTATDGYPNHDVLVPNNLVNAGDPPHILSMLLSGGQRTVSGSSVYNKVPSANPASDYAFCLACHDGSANTARAVNVRQDYIDKGHYFKTTGGGITAGDRIPCSDCHASHNSPTNARLFEPDNTTWTGARPSGLTFASPYAPTNAEYRAVCIFCHNDYNVGNTGNGTPQVRGVEPTPRKYGISGHAASDTQSCKQCHNPHKTPGGGPDCLTCHTSGGAAGTTYDYIDALFKGVGSDNTANQPASVGSLTWSQHGGFVSAGGAARFLYTSPYNTKATNDCFKCHGDRHNNTNALIDADNTDSYSYSPSLGMQDNTAAGITNANAFCLTCHDGNGAASDVQIGNTAPPNVAANYATGGHGRPQASGAYTVSLNNPAYLKCTDCHEVHGSNHAKLLPARKSEGTANFTIPSNFPEKTFRSGGSALIASNIDFTDYSSPASGNGFGTTGDPGDQHAPAGATTGFCDACHRFAGRSNRGTDNVTNKAHAHDGIVGDLNQSSPSQMTFTKDCLECHDTHGTTNLEMVKTTINGVTPVTFTARTAANSFDPVEGGSTANTNSVCVVCHQNSTENASLNVDHNFRTSTVNPDHNEDTNCTACHPHGTTADAKKFGFPQAACNSCHGAATDTAGMPATGDTGIYHTDANNVIGTRGGDNTAHKIHVDYLVNKRAIARSSACYVCHVGGGSQESGGHPANPTNKSFKSGTQPTGSPYVQIALDNTGAVFNVQLAGLTASYSGTAGQAAGATNGWKTCANTKCHYALSPSWSGKQQVTAPPGVMTVSTPDALPAAGNVLQGSTNNVIDKIRLQTDATGTVTDNQFKVRMGVGATAVYGTDIARITFWEDADLSGTVSAGDVRIGGDAVFSGTDNGYTVGPVSWSVPASTTKQVLVVADIGAGAVNGRTMAFSTVNGEIKASYGTINGWTTFTSNTFTVASPGTLTVSTPDALPAAGPVMVGAGNNLVDKINLVASGGFSTVTGLKVKQSGNAVNGTDIANVTFWRDVNSNGSLETGTDVLLGGAATFNGADNTYSVSGLSLTVPSGSTERILVIDNVAAGATASRTIQTQVVDATYVTLSAGTVAGTFPITASNVQTISSGGTLTVTTPDALPAAADIRGASDNNVIDKITLTASTANVTVSGFWVHQLGTAVNGTDIGSVSFVDNTGGANTLLGTATYNSGDATYRLTGLGLAVVVGTPRTILVRADTANGAVAGRTIQTQVNDGYVQVATGTVNTITSFSSTVQTIRALTAVIVTDTAGSTTPVTTTSLSTSGTHQFYATATYSNAALNQNVTTSSAWSRAGTATGSTVGAATGLYTAGSTAGTDNVTATYRGQSDNTSVTVGLTFNSHTYWAYRPSSAVSVGADGNSPNGWTSQTATTLQPGNASFATTTLSPAGLGTNVRFYPYWNGTALVMMRFYSAANYASSNTIAAQTVSGQITLREASAMTCWLGLFDYDPAGAVGNGVQIGSNSGNIAATTTLTSYTFSIVIGSQYTIPAGHRLQLRLWATSSGASSGTTNRVYFGATTAGTSSTSFTISESTSESLAPPRTTGDTTGIACNTCHQFAPDDATAGYKDSNQYYYALPGSHAKHGISLIAGTDPVADNALNSCTICHLAGTNAFGSDHMDGAVDLRSGSIGTRTAGPAYADDGTYAGASRTCSNVYCHAGRTTPQATGQSWGYGTSTCGVCHAVTPPFGKHAIHNNGNVNTTPSNGSTAANYDFSCYYCHPSGAEHVNYPVSAVQAAQVSFSGTLGGQTLSGTYTAGGATAGWDNVTNQGLSWTNGSCATYCHTNGQGGAALVTPTWNHAGFPTATCVGCHDTRGAATTLSTRHRKHTDNTAGTGYNFSCDECHTLTVANDSWTTLNATTGRVNHVDGNLTVSFSTTLRTTAVAISGTYTQGVDNCANTYCHSDGSSIKNGGTIQTSSIRWDNTTTPLPCNSCHGAGGPASGAPNYTTSGSRRNSHPAHASVTCQTCHSLTTTTGNTITTASNHVNGSYQVSGTGFTYTFNASTGSTCAFTAGCHSGTVTWGTTLTGGCFACHAGAEQLYKPLEVSDSVANPVDNNQYASYGHGNSTTYAWDSIAGANFQYSFTGSPNNGCYECHSSGANHVPKSGTDPYRLGAFATNVDGLCNDCHGPTATNAKKALNALNLGILGHNKVNTGSTRTWPGSYDYKCVDCHDPHADGNYYMIRSAINNPASAGDTNAGSNSYGTPKDNTVSAITFTSLAGFGANSYAISGAADGICEVCHNQTTLYNATGSDNAGTHAARTGRCTTCHSHTSGFKGAGHSAGADCKGCHSTAQGTRRAIMTEFNYTAQHAGTWTSIVSADCELCHYEASSDGIVILKQWTGTTTFTNVTYASATLYTTNVFCLSCHSGAAYAKSFSVGGAPKNVGQYWQSTTSLSHNYAPATYNTLPQVTKARSPHGFPGTNKLKQEAWTSVVNQTKYTDAAPVACLECHPAHGSNVVSPTKLKGAAFSDGMTGGKMIKTAEPTLCWTCHDTATVGVKDYWGDSTTPGTHWSGTRLSPYFTYKQRAYASTHQVNDTAQPIACSICHNPHGASVGGQYFSPSLRASWMTSPYKEDRTGWLSGTQRTAQTYMTKLTLSRYGPRASSDFAYNNPKGRGNGFDNGTGVGHDGHFIDENTFGVTGTFTSWTSSTVAAVHMSEPDNTFAGLCATCHTDATYTGTGGVASMKTWLTTGITALGRGQTGWGAAIHNVVKGWAASGTTSDVVNPTNNPDMHGYSAQGGRTCMAYQTGCSSGWDSHWNYNWQGFPRTTNDMASASTAVHQFPCSKCHTPHASELPKLMTTNCIDVGTSTTQRKLHGTQAVWNYPTIGGTAIGASNGAVATLCHNKQKTNTSTGGGWNKVTGW